ncbi:MAG: DEAD/DEAH box helicase family protein [Bacteroidetes bacterium]|nr:DEAD/DEAH box helicase family protein [Bacteroidota bacterium]
MINNLESHLNKISELNGNDFFRKQVPASIYHNLNKNLPARTYQHEAIGRLIYYWQNERTSQEQVHLLFHMATGSGKTLIMAALILYMYEKGYRHFIFFVNSNNIINKTKQNFTNPSSSKYLFSDEITINGKQVQVKETEQFGEMLSDSIQISFTTINGLHSKLNTPRENSLTLSDFEINKMVLLSDEAHHINAQTKKGSKLNKAEADETISWESTVNKILQANPQNALFEFTATAGLSLPEIAKKYQDKIIYDYSLKQFRSDGFSKDVQLLQNKSESLFTRALPALFLSQYRKQLFKKYGIEAKPVILFKSKTIKDSNLFFTDFSIQLDKLNAAKVKNVLAGLNDVRIQHLKHYFATNKIKTEDWVQELKEDFSKEKLITLNTTDDSYEKQLAINSLEEKNNPYRAIFAVDKLNEGWDVLNLFDIVRLYGTTKNESGKPSHTTIAEAQLIGRGARYYPFRIRKNQSLHKRKYDLEPEHELRICEELYYHSPYDPSYIIELNKILIRNGIKPADNENKNTPGKSIPLPRVLSSFPADVINKTYKTRHSQHEKKRVTPIISLGDRIIRKAINKNNFFRFDNLKTIFPHCTSIQEFINSKKYLGGIKIEILNLPDYNKNPYLLLSSATDILGQIAADLED